MSSGMLALVVLLVVLLIVILVLAIEVTGYRNQSRRLALELIQKTVECHKLRERLWNRDEPHLGRFEEMSDKYVGYDPRD